MKKKDIDAVAFSMSNQLADALRLLAEGAREELGDDDVLVAAIAYSATNCLVTAMLTLAHYAGLSPAQHRDAAARAMQIADKALREFVTELPPDVREKILAILAKVATIGESHDPQGTDDRGFVSPN